VTNIPGVFLLKLPLSRTRQAAIAIEINPVDSAGSATKKRGIVVRSAYELDEFNRILANQKLVELVRKMDDVNPKQKDSTTIGRSDVFEI
jgi:transcription initiation factor TFIID subunit TAF12